MQNSTPEIAVATRTFGNSKMQEGLRVKAGTRFAVGKPQGGLQMITAARYRQLLAVRLVRPLGPEDAAAAPAADDPSRKRPIDSHAAEAIEKNEAEAEAKANAEKPKEPMRRPSARAAARRRTQEPDPPAPRLIRPASQPAAAPVGSPNGSPAPASSSAAGPASSTSATSSKPRGRRRGSAG